MKDSTPQAVHLKDYRQPDFYIPNVSLDFILGEETTLVRSKMRVERNLVQASSKGASLNLNGEELELKSIKLNGKALTPQEYQVSKTHLTLASVPDSFELEIENSIEPQKNLSFEGLYKTSGMFCTQCEAESFRKITYFLDRPDVMSVFRVRIEADKAKYPLLLSNGNRESARDLANGRHEAIWIDPFKKPCYLFALVAGNLGVIEDTYKTTSGRQVKLQIFAREGLQDRCRHAMESLKLSMKWDEDTYGLEYDLDLFMIVAADDFNMGAMENKGLNVFNSNYVLANPQTATDTDYHRILAVIGHEYFHNWTGNRVTCRDWFQLSLKEGLTVFRDQRFSSDMSSEAVQRVEQVTHLRSIQFAEDAGPMAHPIRPNSYISIDNFYTITVYEKGAEVIRMMETILGRDGFRKGMDLYFKRHDGQAVTTDDFVAAMADANQADLSLFKNWYDQAGTPVVKVTTDFDAAKQTYSITLAQTCPPTSGQATKKPFHIPVRVGLLGSDGKDLPLQLTQGSQVSAGDVQHTSLVLHLREPQQTFTFAGITERPVLSMLRGFSAPVKIDNAINEDDLEFLVAHDSDPFARWEAAQTLTVRLVQDLVRDYESGHRLREPARLVRAFEHIIDDDHMDPAFKALMMTLPNEAYLGQFYEVMNIDAIHAAREHILRAIAHAHKGQLIVAYRELTIKNAQGVDARSQGERALKGCLLEFITLNDEERDLELAADHIRHAKNMTDELSGLNALNRTPSPLRHAALVEFFEKWKNEPLVVNKWLATQAMSPASNTYARVKELVGSPAFDKTNPNKIYSLLVAFSRNLVRFHDKCGEPYEFIADQVMDIDSRNPQVAARLISAFNQWRMFDVERQQMMKAQLSRILAKPGLSSNVFEIASKTLGN